MAVRSFFMVGEGGGVSKTVPKMKFGPEINDSKHICFLSFNLKFSSRKSPSQVKLAKKITHFTIPFCSIALKR